MQEDDVVGKIYDARIVRRLMGYVRPQMSLVAAALVCLMIDGLMQLVGPLMTQRVIDVALPTHSSRLVWQSAALFGASLATTGWQKLPSGVIIQWGVATTTAANTPVTFTYPLAFPTAQVGVFASLLNTSGASYTASAVLTPSKTAAQVQCTYPGTASVNVLALGY